MLTFSPPWVRISTNWAVTAGEGFTTKQIATVEEMLLSALQASGRIGVVGRSDLGTLLGFVLSGLAVFYIARAYRLKKEGIDINWTFQSVPPV